MPFARIKNLDIFFQSYGDPRLPTVILVAGLGMHSGSWPKKMISLLIKKGLRVITFDNRDSGRSSLLENKENFQSVPLAIGRTLLRLPVSSAYTLDDMAIDLEHLMNFLEIPAAHIVGASMGGMIAQVLASIRPSKVKSLTAIMSASGNPRTGTGKIRTIHSLLVQPKKLDTPRKRAAHFQKLLTSLKSPLYQYTKDDIEELLTPISAIDFDPKASERQLLAILASGDRTPQLLRLTVPTLVIHGTDDPLIPLAAGRELATLIPHAEFKIFERMGHDLPPPLWQEIVSSIADHVWRSER